MKFIPLVWAGIWRKRGRSILILMQVLIAFTLDAVLQGLLSTVGLTLPRLVTPHLAVISLCWALSIALIGGLLPALRAAELPVTTALRAT